MKFLKKWDIHKKYFHSKKSVVVETNRTCSDPEECPDESKPEI